ncbi:MAG TPA: diguanylate cyclase, partial [Acidimicrobiia bacterium]|nr:diguanylate cyclase [Acidimicrobiia bacterium]
DLRSPMVLDGAGLTVSASVGMAIASSGARGVDELLRRADMAMYRHKRARRSDGVSASALQR